MTYGLHGQLEGRCGNNLSGYLVPHTTTYYRINTLVSKSTLKISPEIFHKRRIMRASGGQTLTIYEIAKTLSIQCEWVEIGRLVGDRDIREVPSKSKWFLGDAQNPLINRILVIFDVKYSAGYKISHQEKYINQIAMRPMIL